MMTFFFFQLFSLCALPRQVAAKLLSSKSARLIVRNLAFSCTEDALRAAFAPCGTIKSITLPRAPPAADADEGRIKGFAFVEFETEASAAAAIKTYCLSIPLIISFVFCSIVISPVWLRCIPC